jgi:ketosteroid isomerase-like protein
MSGEAVRKAVQEGNQRFGASVARRDYVSLAALYTEDARLLPPDAPIIVGRKAIRDFWASAIPSLGFVGATLNTLDLEASEDAACEVGEALLDLATGRMTVKYVVVWRKGQDGSWRLHRDIWNSLPITRCCSGSGQRG